ncbi:MAG TPA: energy-coupling factor transporter transmembrane component T [Cellulomonas sp.]
MTLLGAHRTARTPLDRAPAGTKLIALAVLGVAVVATRGVPASLTLLAVALLAAVLAALPPRATLRGLLPVLVTAVLAGAYQAWARGWGPAVEVVADLLTLVLAAAVVTATTPTDRLLDVLARAARPLRHLGVAPDTVALAIALVLRTVPEIARTVHEVRDAARARGVERDPRVWLTPAVLRVVGRARDLGEALAARGIVE